MAVEQDVTLGRSPRYPKYPLMAAVGYVKRLYDGAHRSVTDTQTAYKVMGFVGKTGASATALGAVRQFGLIENIKGGLRVSDLAMAILEPSSATELTHALKEAANQPSIFSQINEQFPTLPKSDEPIRSFLIRQLDFSKSGADDCIAAFRETYASLPSAGDPNEEPAIVAGAPPLEPKAVPVEQELAVPAIGSLMRIPLTRECYAELRFTGPLSEVALDRLVRHVELMKDVWAE